MRQAIEPEHRTWSDRHGRSRRDVDARARVHHDQRDRAELSRRVGRRVQAHRGARSSGSTDSSRAAWTPSLTSTVVGLGRYVPRIARIANETEAEHRRRHRSLHLQRRAIPLPLPPALARALNGPEFVDGDVHHATSKNGDRRHWCESRRSSSAPPMEPGVTQGVERVLRDRCSGAPPHRCTDLYAHACGTRGVEIQDSTAHLR